MPVPLFMLAASGVFIFPFLTFVVAFSHILAVCVHLVIASCAQVWGCFLLFPWAHAIVVYKFCQLATASKLATSLSTAVYFSKVILGFCQLAQTASKVATRPSLSTTTSTMSAVTVTNISSSTAQVKLHEFFRQYTYFFLLLRAPNFTVLSVSAATSSQSISNPRGIRNNPQLSPLRNLRLQAQRSCSMEVL